MTTTVSVGTSGRTYSTPQAAWDALPSTLADDYVFELYNDSGFSGTLICSGKTMGAFTVTVRPASGQGFTTHASKLTNRQYFIEANGVSWSYGGGNMITIDVDNVIIEGLQLACSNKCVNQTSAGTGVRVRNCIGVGFAGGTGGSTFALNGGKAVNCLAVVKGGGVGFASNGSNSEFRNCTAIATDSAGNYGFTGNFDSPVYFNCAAFNFVTPFKDAGGSSNFNATDGASAPGANSVASLTTSNQFVNSAAGSEDIRVKAGNGLGIGTRDQTNTGDLDIVGSSRSTSAPTIGQWEYASGGSSATLTGGSATFAQGNVGFTKSGSGALSGTAASFAQGSVAPSQAGQAGLSGTVATFSQGSVGAGSGPGTITISDWANNTGSALAGQTGINVAIYHLTTRALVHAALGLTIDGGSDVAITHASITPGQTYRVLTDQDGNTVDHGCGRFTAT